MTGQGEGLSFDSSAKEMLKNVCKDIQGQKKRLGGDFAVATVVFSKKSRDLCRLDNEFAFMYTVGRICLTRGSSRSNIGLLLRML